MFNRLPVSVGLAPVSRGTQSASLGLRLDIKDWAPAADRYAGGRWGRELARRVACGWLSEARPPDARDGTMDANGIRLHEANLNGRQRRKLRQARENGYLNAGGATGGGVADLLMAFSLWCWRLRLPVVWLERCSRHSRYGTVRLELYTTAHQLTPRGQAELRELAPGAVDISPHDARWNRVPLGRLEELAGRVIKAAVRAGNVETAAVRLLEVECRGPAKVIPFERAQAASA